jgi:glyoxylase-like metal-dependent hydrolase (beta-lactamase superfamily II)
MQIQKFITGSIKTNTYLLYNKKEAILIDCGGQEETVLNFLEENNLKLRYILLTHGHFDHTYINKIKEKTNAKIGLNEKDRIMPVNILAGKIKPIKTDFNLKEDKIIELGSTKIRVIETPGHSPGSCSFYIENKNILFSGDTLFLASIGRTDIPGGNYDRLMKSIKEKLLILPDQTKLYPGHGQESTIGKEKQRFTKKFF